MGTKAKVLKFEKVDQKLIRGKINHSRTGACTAKGKCFHGKKH